MPLLRLANLLLVVAAPAAIGMVPASSHDEPVPVALDTDLAALEREAIGLAVAFGAIPTGPDGDPCPPDRLEVSWAAPGDGFAVGAYVEPVGPAPTPGVTRVNGVVRCRGAGYAFMGFEAVWTGGRWLVEDTPALDESDHHEAPNLDADPAPEPEAGPDPVEGEPVPAPPAPAGIPMPAELPEGIDGYAPYQPQTGCDPSAKPGVLGFRDLALGGHPGSRNLGITRGCSVGGRSEHKEGRAFDWGVRVDRPAEAAAAQALVGQLLATDTAGNAHALARRMGVMYIIWDRQIWSAHRHAEGWRPYRGASAHTDHVHVSFSWAGARAETSYWSGVPVPTGIGEHTPSPFRPRAPGGGGDGPLARSDQTDDNSRAERKAAWEAERERKRAERAERKAAWEAERDAAKAAWRAERDAARAERQAAKEAARAQRDQERAERKAAWEAERERKRAERAERKAAWEAERERRRQEREQRRSTTTTAPPPSSTTTTAPATTTTTEPPSSTTTTTGATTTTTAPP